MDLLDFDDDTFLVDSDSDFDSDLDLMPDEYPGYANWDLYDVDDEPDVGPRCGLCQFKFEALDSVVVFNPLNRYSPSPWETKYHETDTSGYLETGYHSSCVDQFAVDFSLGNNTHFDVWDATHYGDAKYGNIGNEPLPSFEANRLRRLKRMFAGEFMTTIGGRLPLEVCENIGRYCLRDYAVRLLKDAWRKKSHFGTRDAAFRVTKSHEVWAQHIEFEGIQYIKSLSTTRRNESDTKLFGPAHGTRVNIYFAEDPRGIREVIMTQDDYTPLTQGEGLTWVINRRIALPFWFKSKSDGLKLRELATTRTKKLDANYRQRHWALLPNDLDDCRLAPPLVADREVSTEPIRAVDWNLPGCRGYSILVFMDCVCDIIPNTTGGPSSQLMDADNNHPGAWTYVPIDEDERVVELWSRRGKLPGDSGWLVEYYNLIIRTSKGRSFALGYDIESRSNKDGYNFTYQGIAVLPLTQPSRMLYCRNGSSKFWLCVDQAESLDQRKINLSLPKPLKPTAYTGKQFLSSTVELRDVRTIAICRSWRNYPDEGIVGILFTYADGRQRCIGQIRLDHMDAPLAITSGKIWLGCDKSQNEHLPEGFWPRTNKIKWVEVDKPLRDKDCEYLEVPLGGSLEWQSSLSSRFCHDSVYHHSVYHHESSGLQDMVDEVDLVLARDTESGGRPRGVVKTFSVVI
ncbi:hypothetical protein FANTH_3655 [Fusarium anthophilum]|uniref:Uncharacterized protein n=1 Tax=Fusarium anthophilum TaxID=48485 RepID=A0A8H4ZSJ2_9HYPO|nr:hypothetical protein FANTH_3655 [Fusarium anthophilum]